MLRVRSVWKLAGLIGLGGLTGFSAVRPAAATKPAQKKEPQVQALDLHRGEATVAAAPPIRVATFGFRCDLEGDIYLAYSGSAVVVSESGVMSKLPLSKITPGTLQIVQYPVPPRIPDFQGLVTRFDFDVASDGTVYALFNTARRALDGTMIPEFVIAKYNDDGTVDSYTHVVREAQGVYLQPLRMAVFGNGDFLLSGTTVRNKSILGTFTGLFDSSGDLVRMLTLGKPPTTVPHHPDARTAGKAAKLLTQHMERLEAQAKSPAGLEGATQGFSGKDGNVYLLQGTGGATLYVIDLQGEVLHKFHIQAPKAGLSPVQMAQAGPSHLYIYYVHIATGAPKENLHQRSMIEVLSTTTGKVTAVYRMPEEKGMLLPGCATSASNFTFLGTSKDHHLEVVSYSAQ